MPKTALEYEIQSRIEAFVQELSELVKAAALESVNEALGGSAPRRGPGRPRGTGRKTTARRGGKRIRRSTGDVEAIAARVLQHVRSNQGQGVSEIGKALGLSSKDMRLPIQKLLADKKLKTKGQKRGTTYHTGSGGATRKKTTRKKTTRKKTTRKRRARK